MLEARDLDVKYVVQSVSGLAACLLYKESNRNALIKQRQPRRMRNSMEHDVHALLLHEQLVDVEGGAAGVTQAEAGHDVLLVDLPERGVVVDTF